MCFHSVVVNPSTLRFGTQPLVITCKQVDICLRFITCLQIVSASQAGDIQFMDIRKHTSAYLTIEAHRRSLTALAVHRHAPVIASGSAKQIIKVFSLEGEQLSMIRYYPSFMAQKIGAVSCLSFHPYRVLLAAGTGSGPTDACISIYADENSPAR